MHPGRSGVGITCLLVARILESLLRKLENSPLASVDIFAPGTAWDELLGSKEMMGKGRDGCSVPRGTEWGNNGRDQVWGAGVDGGREPGRKRSDLEEVKLEVEFISLPSAL